MYKEAMKGWIKHFDFMLIDILCLELSFLIAYIYRSGIGTVVIFPEMYRTLAVIIIIIDICIMFFSNSYEDIIRRGYLVELKKVIIHCTCVILGMIMWMFVTQRSEIYSRMIVLLMYPISICIMTIARLAWKRLLRIRIQKGKIFRKVVVVTTEERAAETVKGLLQPYRNYNLEAVILYDNMNPPVESICKIPVIAGRNSIIQYARENIIDEVFIDLNEYEKETERLANRLVSMGFVVHVNLTQFNSNMKNKKIQGFGKYVVFSSGMKFVSPRQLLFKRIMDICGALVGLLITGIAYLIFAPIIKRQSPGPVFFSQERVGRNGRIFKIYKFRTMYPDAEERKKELMSQNKMSGFMFKMDHDPRIFPIGHFLRKRSIDELPQFLNVLKGDMSIVGTRPPTVEEYKQYGMQHRKRLAMNPGITGMWQVSGRSDIVDFEEVVALDAKYIEEWTLSMDIKIIWKTVKIVLTGEGAV